MQCLDKNREENEGWKDEEGFVLEEKRGKKKRSTKQTRGVDRGSHKDGDFRPTSKQHEYFTARKREICFPKLSLLNTKQMAISQYVCFSVHRQMNSHFSDMVRIAVFRGCGEWFNGR